VDDGEHFFVFHTEMNKIIFILELRYHQENTDVLDSLNAWHILSLFLLTNEGITRCFHKMRKNLHGTPKDVIVCRNIFSSL
jgi:hypothetical protein